MWKIFLISFGFCIFIPFQVEACALAFFDTLSVPVKKALREAGIHTIEDLRKHSRRELMTILPGGERTKWVTVNKIEVYLFGRREYLARDFLVEDIGISKGSGNSLALARAGIRTEEDLLEWTESGLLALEGVGKVAVERIKAYFSGKGKSLAQDGTVEGVELSIEIGRSSGRVDNYNIENLGTENQVGTILPTGDPKQNGVRESQRPPVVRLW